MPDISTMQTDSSKVFKGSAGSYKLVDNSVSNTSYVYYLSKSGDMTRNESSSSAWSGYVDIAYDTKVPPANLSSFIIPSDANGNPDETKIAADKVKMKTIIDFVDAGE